MHEIPEPVRGIPLLPWDPAANTDHLLYHQPLSPELASVRGLAPCLAQEKLPETAQVEECHRMTVATWVNHFPLPGPLPLQLWTSQSSCLRAESEEANESPRLG